ncbi:unnamed protein product [Oreochromis niloticus]|nr:unnamed protein product [Mustela putorius furo]
MNIKEDLRTLSSRCRNLLGFQRWSVHSLSVPTCLPLCPALRIITSPHSDHLPSKLCLRLRMRTKPLPLPPFLGSSCTDRFPSVGFSIPSMTAPRLPHRHF